MRKEPRRFELHRETLRHLSELDSRQVLGGGTTTRYRTCTCAPTWDCTIGC